MPVPSRFERDRELDLVPYERATGREMEHRIGQNLEVRDRDQVAARLLPETLSAHLDERELEDPDVDHVSRTPPTSMRLPSETLR